MFTQSEGIRGNVTETSETTLGVDRRTSEAVKGIRGQSYPILGILPLCSWTPVTLVGSPSYPTFTRKVILEIRGQLPHIRRSLRCSQVERNLP